MLVSAFHMVSFKSLVSVPYQVNGPRTWWRSNSVSDFSKFFESYFCVLWLTVKNLDEGDFVFVVLEELLPVADDFTAFVVVNYST